MNIDFRKTTLNDEASIYQKRKSKYTKKDINNLSKQEKWNFFKDYYLKKVLIVLLVIVALCILVKDMFFDSSKCVLYVSCVNECQLTDTQPIIDDLENYVEKDNDKDHVSVVSYDLEIPQFNMSFVTQINAGTIDLVICPYDYFIETSRQGLFVDLSTFLPSEIYDDLSDRIITSSLTDMDAEGNITSYSDPAPFGIDISNNAHFIHKDEKVVLCIVNGTLNKANAINALSYFTSVE